MSKLFLTAAAGLVAAASLSSQNQVQISIGIREAGAATLLPFPGVGTDGGAVGGIEWVKLDGQTLTLDGTWQPFIFTIPTDPLTSFAGTTANGLLDGTWGTIENIRVRNHLDLTRRITLWIDDVTVTVTPPAGPPATTTIQDFESYVSGNQVMVQEPCFSGSTHHNLAIYDPALVRCVQSPIAIVHDSTVDVTNVYGGVNSDKITFQFLPSTPPAPHVAVTPGSRWLRLTTNFLASYGTGNPYAGNPAIPFDQQATVLFWMKGELGSSTRYSPACPAVAHTMAGPQLYYGGSAILGQNLTLQGSNIIGVLCALLVGQPIDPPIPLDLIGGLPNSKLCVNAFVSVPVQGQPVVNLTLPMGTNPSIVGLTFATEILDYDTNSVSPTVTLPFGTSQTLLFTPGTF